jgi:hypothetical protein
MTLAEAALGVEGGGAVYLTMVLPCTLAYQVLAAAPRRPHPFPPPSTSCWPPHAGTAGAGTRRPRPPRRLHHFGHLVRWHSGCWLLYPSTPPAPPSTSRRHSRCGHPSASPTPPSSPLRPPRALAQRVLAAVPVDPTRAAVYLTTAMPRMLAQGQGLAAALHPAPLATPLVSGSGMTTNTTMTPTLRSNRRNTYSQTRSLIPPTTLPDTRVVGVLLPTLHLPQRCGTVGH